MKLPLVSVVTPTWNRHQSLLERCIPSVQAQTYLPIEHIVVSGPDPELRRKLRKVRGVRFHEINPNVADGGATPRRIGSELAKGSLVAYLDDDNAYRPRHIARLVVALESQPEIDFVYSQMLRHPTEDVIGASAPAYCQIDTSLLMHRRKLLMKSAWQPPAGYGAPDWEVVERWLAAGARWAHVPEITVDYWLGDPGGARS